MFRKHRLATAVGAVGALVLAAHAILGAAGIMTTAQWQSGAVLGLILLVGGGVRVVTAR
jgi:hypothetical protein